MKNYKKVFFAVFFGIYVLGIIIGGVSQTKHKNQEDMYIYLENAVSEYEVAAKDGIISIGRENLTYFAICAAGALFKLAVPGIGACIFLRGYAAGFAITAALRLYGMKGILLCAANITSLFLIIPLLCHCGSAAIENFAENKFDRKTFLKGSFFLIVLMCVVFVADCVLRGGLSAIFTDFAAGVLK